MTKILVSILSLLISTSTLAAPTFLQDVANMCLNFSSATHPPCNPANGFEIMIEHIEHNCQSSQVECAQALNKICLAHANQLQTTCSPSITIADQLISLNVMARKAAEVELLKIHPCSLDAMKRAKALFKLHNEIDSDLLDDGRPAYTIDQNVVLKAPLLTPSKKTKLSVLEIKGGVYKGSYRMRFIYAPTQTSDSCALIGQEILEETNL